MIDPKIRSYYIEALDELRKNKDIDNDPDVFRVFESFALLEAKLRFDMDQREEELVKYIISIVAPELLVNPPDCGVMQLLGDAGNVLKQYSEFFYENSFWRTSRDYLPIKTSIDKILYLNHEEDPRLSQLGIKDAILLALDSPDSNVDVYINSDFGFINRLLIDILPYASELIDYDTGEIIGELVLDTYSKLDSSNIVGDPYSELYDFTWLQVKYHFFRMNLYRTKKKLNVLIKTSGLIKKIESNLFLLNCVPISGLFSKTIEPLKIDKTEELHSLNSLASKTNRNEIYKVKEIDIYEKNESLKLNLGSDYFLKIDDSDFLVKFGQNFHDKIANIQVLLRSETGNILDKTLISYEKNYIKAKVIKVYTNVKNRCNLDYDIISLYQRNNFQEFFDKNKLIDLVKKVNSLLDIDTSIIEIDCMQSIDIIKIGTNLGMYNIHVIKIKIESAYFILALVWGRIFVNLTAINMKVKIRIVDIYDVLIYEFDE